MLKFTVLLVLLGVGGTAAYELSRETETAPVVPRIAAPAPPVLVQRAQAPGGSDNHPASRGFANMHPGWRFRSEHLWFSPIFSPTGQLAGRMETVQVYGTGPAGIGGPHRGTLPNGWEQVGASGTEETWRLLVTASVQVP